MSLVQWNVRRPPLASATLRGPDTVTVGDEARFRLDGRNASDAPVPTPWAEWSVSDTSIATVDSTGRVRARRAGAVRLSAHLGIAMTASRDLEVRPPDFTVRLRELWDGDLARWIAFGDPAPARGSWGGQPVLFINGDERLTSGVFSAATYPARNGLGVRVRFRALIAEPVWQALILSLSAAPTDAQLAAWDDRAGGRRPLDWDTENTTCTLAFPQGEGYDIMRWPGLTAAGLNVPLSAPATFGDGRWHEATLQIMPDGRCGGALDGRVLGMSSRSLPLDRPLRLHIHGQSVKTTVSVGEVEAWTGVRPGIPWSGGGDGGIGLPPP
jgi:hypothetical protein